MSIVVPVDGKSIQVVPAAPTTTDPDVVVIELRPKLQVEIIRRKTNRSTRARLEVNANTQVIIK